MTNFYDDILKPSELDADDAGARSMAGHFAIARSLYEIAKSINRITELLPATKDDLVNLGAGLREGWDS